jgi:hypothetical protein
VLPVEEVPVAEPPVADAPEPLAPEPPLAPPPDCASAMATANSTLANKPKPYVAFLIFDSSASSANAE